MESAAGLAMETSKVKSVVRNQAEAKLNQLEHSEPAGTMNQLQALEEEDEPTGTLKENQLEHLSGPSMMMSLVTTSCSADEVRSAGAKGPAGTGAKKNRKLELERRKDVVSVASKLQRYESSRKINPVEGYSALHIQTTKNSAEAQGSSRHESAAKQLTIYEELSKLDVNY
ncbi:hypothetical protein F511_21792 [Dorcoceras hygrometricum]|uniref:Uncharacterized protein n=1 Tax=Dorcoceras hygrometricum TaxID=472368 RepID=A0A2Z7BKR5_9LAMI|nr:hypothetical protein F511_21792 [Dorcoceras hygrometricum]